MHELRKFFKVGDHVKVVAGRYEGDTGMVVKMESSLAIVFSDLTMSEVGEGGGRGEGEEGKGGEGGIEYNGTSIACCNLACCLRFFIRPASPLSVPNGQLLLTCPPPLP